MPFHDDVIKWKHFPRYWPLCGAFDFSLMWFCGIYLEAISQRVPMSLFCLMSLKIMPLKLLPHFRGAHELKIKHFTDTKPITPDQIDL